MATIALEGMEFYAYYGCMEEERIIGARFIIDVYLEADTSKAEISDHLKDTVNYQQVYQSVKKSMEGKSKLLEHVARRVLDGIMKEFPGITSAKVSIAKLHPALGGKMESVRVMLEERR
ncbi:MAG: dihydroneopterin aldolase [Bacteroidetes bacterium]|nr:dihydroneopterin aldolase [Bacteroidota bacterium]